MIHDDYPMRKHRSVQKWLGEHPRFKNHFTPTYASWLNLVERFFHDITSEPLRRDAFARVPAIVVAIDEYIAHHNNKPKPFIWNQSAWEILNKVIRANKCLSSKRNEAIRSLRQRLKPRRKERLPNDLANARPLSKLNQSSVAPGIAALCCLQGRVAVCEFDCWCGTRLA